MVVDDHRMRSLAGRPATRIAGLALVVGGGAALRLLHLGASSLWLDEARGVFIVESFPSARIARGVVLQDYHSLWNLFLQGWVRLSGDGELALRLPAVLFGVLIVWATWRLSERLFQDRAQALLAAGLTAGHAFLVYYSQEARTYALSGLLAVMAGLLVARLLGQREVRWPWWLALTLTLALLQYSHLYAGFLLLAFNLVAVPVAWRRPRLLRRWLLAQLLPAAVALYLVPRALAAHRELLLTVGWKFWLERDPVANTVAWLYTFSGGLPADLLDRNLPALVLGALSALATGALAATGLAAGLAEGEQREGVRLVAACALIPPVAVVLGSWLVLPAFSVYLVRYLIFSCPFWWILVARGARRAAASPRPGRALLAWGALAAILCTAVLANWNARYGYTSRLPRSADFRTLAAELAARAEPGDLVVHSSYFSYFPLWYYLRDALPQRALFGTYWERWLPQEHSLLTSDLPAMVKRQGYRRVWLVAFYDWTLAPHPGDEWRIDRAVRRMMPTGYPLLERHHFNDVDLYLYGVRGADPDEDMVSRRAVSGGRS